MIEINFTQKTNGAKATIFFSPNETIEVHETKNKDVILYYNKNEFFIDDEYEEMIKKIQNAIAKSNQHKSNF